MERGHHVTKHGGGRKRRRQGERKKGERIHNIFHGLKKKNKSRGKKREVVII